MILHNMNKNIAGIWQKINKLHGLFKSDKPEFIAIYGRSLQ